jgi:class 3 adenylate cyclase/tetratricopeptide (TPR) repeat protein
MTNLHQWLESVGLGQYADLFATNEIDWETLLLLGDEEFDKLGVPLEDRKRLVKAAAEYRSSKPTASDGLNEITRIARSAGIKAERRHLTVLICDIVGSTRLSTRLDPEDLAEVLRKFQSSCGDAIHCYDGHIARFMGDGILAYFGFPRAHEDDAERAVNSALRMVDLVNALSFPTEGKLKLRIGIATGLVVVGDLIGEGPALEFALVGETPNLAARLQQLAKPNQILVSSNTRRLLGGRFALKDVGDRAIKGIDRRVRVWRVLKSNFVEGRFETWQTSRLTRFVGRDPELSVLRKCYRMADRGSGRLVLISGEPGIGKSRLVTALRKRLAEKATCVLSFQCSPYHTSSAWYPVIRYLEDAAGISPDTLPTLKLKKLETLVEQHLEEQSEKIIPMLAALLDVPTDGRYTGLRLTPLQLKIRTFTALLRLLQARTRDQPVLLVFEDVHWIDPTSLELLERLRDQVQSWRMLVLVLFRPELTLPWTDQPHVTALTINRLDRLQIAAMIKSLAEQVALPPSTIDQIVAKTDGVPLFIEEVTKAVLETINRKSADSEVSSETTTPLTVPDTLHDSLMARLDQLAPMKTVAQIAAVIGREFSLELLQAIANLPKSEVRAGIDRLLASGLVYRSGHLDSKNFTFKHALVQEEAYASLLHLERRELHGKIARTLSEKFVKIGEAAPELLAHHHTQAGENKTAIDYWLAAAQQSSKRSAFVEASTHLQMALNLLTKLPATEDRHRFELRLQHSLGSALAAGKGFGTADTKKVFSRALELCDRFESSSTQAFSVLNGLIGVHIARGEFEQSRDLAEDILARARRQEDPTARLMGHRALGMSLFGIGELAAARVQLRNSLEYYNVTLHGPLALIFFQDFKVSAQAYMGLASVLQGNIKDALVSGSSAVAHAELLGHPHSTCYALSFLAGAHLLCRDVQPVYPIIDRNMVLAREYGFANWIAAGQMLRGWARLELGDSQQALAEIRLSVEALEATGGFIQFARYLLASALFKADRADDANEIVDQELLKLGSTSGRWYEAELHRLKGELQRVRGETAAAEACYEAAIAVAARQGASLWQLRAENNLALLRRAQGRFAEVHARLAPLCASLSHEAKSVDLLEAEALLSKCPRS